MLIDVTAIQHGVRAVFPEAKVLIECDKYNPTYPAPALRIRVGDYFVRIDHVSSYLSQMDGLATIVREVTTRLAATISDNAMRGYK
jgi:hypothetical protein